MNNEKVKQSLNITLNIFLFLVISLVIIFTVYAFNTQRNNGIPKFFEKSYLTVLSDSMNEKSDDFDGFKRGDIVVIERYTWTQASQTTFSVGDIITFKWVDNNGNHAFLTHRIIEVNEDERYYITQGDVANALGYSSNPADGHAEKVYFIEVEGEYISTIKGLGNFLLFLGTPTGFLICIVLPLVALFIFEIFNFKNALIDYRKTRKTKDKSTDEIEKEIAELQKKLADKKE